MSNKGTFYKQYRKPHHMIPVDGSNQPPPTTQRILVRIWCSREYTLDQRRRRHGFIGAIPCPSCVQHLMYHQIIQYLMIQSPMYYYNVHNMTITKQWTDAVCSYPQQIKLNHPTRQYKIYHTVLIQYHIVLYIISIYTSI